MKVLIVDDNPDFCSTIADIVGGFGFDTHILHDPQETLNYLSKFDQRISVILLDIEFGTNSKLNGMDVLEHCRIHYPSIPVVMISGKGTIEMAVKATKLGAINFIEKSILNKEILRDVLSSAASKIGSEGQVRDLLNFLKSQGIIGKSKIILEIGDSIHRFGKTNLNVLITGETGTGKKLVAKAIHSISNRAKFRFVTVDIPNIPRDLFQSELFGSVKGSYTGSSETRKGLFHEAHKGTLFLDEIGDLPIDLQANLFNPIEEKLIRKVGSTENEELDVRFVSATDKDLLFAMKEARFREQLYHRLRECEIYIPPLSERREDIPEIIEYYTKYHNENNNDNKVFPPSAVEFLQEQEWAGNVRELISVLKQSLQTADSKQIEIAPLHKIVNSTSQPGRTSTMQERFLSPGGTLKEDIAHLDKKKVEATLERTAGNVSKAAAQLGISRETLHNKIRKYEINTQQFRNRRGK
jgi:DNA-binding NtrC family response regulator